MDKKLIDFQKEVAQKHQIGNSLVTGHKASYFNEATELYVEYILQNSDDVEFAEWCMRNYKISEIDPEKWCSDFIGYETERYTSEQLYELFQKRNNGK